MWHPLEFGQYFHTSFSPTKQSSDPAVADAALPHTGVDHTVEPTDFIDSAAWFKQCSHLSRVEHVFSTAQAICKIELASSPSTPALQKALYDACLKVIARHTALNPNRGAGDSATALRQYAEAAVAGVKRMLQARLKETWPELSRFEVAHQRGFTTDAELFNALSNKADVAQAAQAPLWALRAVPRILAETPFSANKIQAAIEQLEQLKADLYHLTDSLNPVIDGPLMLSLNPHEAGLMKAQVSRIVASLKTKQAFLTDLREKDPQLNQNVVGNWLLWIVSAQAIARQILAKTRQVHASSNQPSIEMERLRNQRIAALEAVGNTLSALKHTHQNISRDSTSSLGEPFTASSTVPQYPPIREDKVREHLANIYRAQNLPVPSGFGKRLRAERVKELDQGQAWLIIERDMVISRDRVTRHFRSRLTPAASLGDEVSGKYHKHNLCGVSTGNTAEETGHARNLWLSELTRVVADPYGQQTEVPLFSYLRHSIVDAWGIPDATVRAAANRKAAKEILTAAIITTPTLKNRLSTAVNDSPMPPAPRLVHVNLNLATADRLRGFTSNSAEGIYTRNQFKAFEENRGLQRFEIQAREVQIDVEPITFSFGVNAMAMQAPAVLTWSTINAHNRQSMATLLGRLEVGSVPGGVIGHLTAKLSAARDKLLPHGLDIEADSISQQRERMEDLLGQIQLETDLVRHMFNTTSYQHASDDPYQMPRHIMQLVELGAQASHLADGTNTWLSISAGCRSNNDRGSVADCEIKTAAIVRDFGGLVIPSQPFTEQDRQIYRITMAAAGGDELTRQNRGLPGNKSVGDVAKRIDDEALRRRTESFKAYAKSRA